MTREEVLATRKTQIDALKAAMKTAEAWSGPGPKPATYMDAADVQAEIDRLEDFWALQDEAAVDPPPPPPPVVPAASDAWRNAKPGTKLQIDGAWFIVVGMGIFGNSLAPTDAPVVQATPTMIPVESVINYARAELLKSKDSAVQAVWSAFAEWLGKQ